MAAYFIHGDVSGLSLKSGQGKRRKTSTPENSAHRRFVFHMYVSFKTVVLCIAV